MKFSVSFAQIFSVSGLVLDQSSDVIVEYRTFSLYNMKGNIINRTVKCFDGNFNILVNKKVFRK